MWRVFGMIVPRKTWKTEIDAQCGVIKCKKHFPFWKENCRNDCHKILAQHTPTLAPRLVPSLDARLPVHWY